MYNNFLASTNRICARAERKILNNLIDTLLSKWINKATNFLIFHNLLSPSSVLNASEEFGNLKKVGRKKLWASSCTPSWNQLLVIILAGHSTDWFNRKWALINGRTLTNDGHWTASDTFDSIHTRVRLYLSKFDNLLIWSSLSKVRKILGALIVMISRLNARLFDCKSRFE